MATPFYTIDTLGVAGVHVELDWTVDIPVSFRVMADLIFSTRQFGAKGPASDSLMGVLTNMNAGAFVVRSVENVRS